MVRTMPTCSSRPWAGPAARGRRSARRTARRRRPPRARRSSCSAAAPRSTAWPVRAAARRCQGRRASATLVPAVGSLHPHAPGTPGCSATPRSAQTRPLAADAAAAPWKAARATRDPERRPSVSRPSSMSRPSATAGARAAPTARRAPRRPPANLHDARGARAAGQRRRRQHRGDRARAGRAGGRRHPLALPAPGRRPRRRGGPRSPRVPPPRVLEPRPARPRAARARARLKRPQAWNSATRGARTKWGPWRTSARMTPNPDHT